MCLSSHLHVERLTLGMPQQPHAQNTTLRSFAKFSNSSLSFRGHISVWSYTSGTLHLLQLRTPAQTRSVPGSKGKGIRCLQQPLQVVRGCELEGRGPLQLVGITYMSTESQLACLLLGRHWGILRSLLSSQSFNFPMKCKRKNRPVKHLSFYIGFYWLFEDSIHIDNVFWSSLSSSPPSMPGFLWHTLPKFVL